MTNEEMERAISFLLENQARHDSEIAALREMIADTNRAVQVMAQSGAEFNTMVTRAIANLAESQQQTQAELRETQAGMRETQAGMRETDARLRDTDARLNALISVVERLAGGA